MAHNPEAVAEHQTPAVDGIVGAYNARLLAIRANFGVSDEDRATYSAERSRVMGVFHGLLSKLEEVDYQPRAARTVYKPVELGEHEVDGRVSRLVVEPSIEARETGSVYHLHFAIPKGVTGTEHLHYLNSEGVGHVQFETDGIVTREALANLQQFGRLLNDVATAAGVELDPSLEA